MAGEGTTTRGPSSGRNAAVISAARLLSKVLGLVRERAFAHFLGSTDAADVVRAALKIPNLLQNLLGDQALSQSFQPVYGPLLERGKTEEARRLAWSVGSLLVAVTTLLVAAGVLLTPWLILLVAPGFAGAKRELTVALVRVMFPGVGLLVSAGWCMGVLGAHRRFFLPNVASVLWNLAMLLALLLEGGRRSPEGLATVVIWASLAGCLLQLSVQLPLAWRLAGRPRLGFNWRSPHVRTVVAGFLPRTATRGVNQVSAYVDVVLASLLPAGALAFLSYGQTLQNMVVSLFGSAVAQAELVELSRETDETRRPQRAREALRLLTLVVVPCAVAFAALGDCLVGVLYLTGRFTQSDLGWVWAVLAGSSVGLVASNLGQVYQTVYFSLCDTRTPFWFTSARVVLTAALGWTLAFPVPAWLGLEPRAGVVGLAVGAGLAAWLEFALLRAGVARRLGTRVTVPARFLAQVWLLSSGAAALAFATKLATLRLGFVPAAVLALGVYGAAFAGGAAATGVPEATALLAAGLRRVRRLIRGTRG
jgi:putative peptidoglycan lipid II flippase